MRTTKRKKQTERTTQSLNHTLFRQATRPLVALLLLWLLLGTLLRCLCGRICRLRSRGRAYRLRLGTTMQSLVLEGLGDSLVEGLALGLSNPELELARLAGTVASL